MCVGAGSNKASVCAGVFECAEWRQITHCTARLPSLSSLHQPLSYGNKASAEAITARCLRAALRRLINIQSQLFRHTSSFQTGLLNDWKAGPAAAHRE